VSKLNITAGEAAGCLRILEEAHSPLVAADLARELALAGSRESQRRHVRAIVEHLRDNGSMIVATRQEGYSLTDDPKKYRDYLERRQIGDKHDLGETHKQKKILTDAKNQGLLFDMWVRYGVATAGYRV